MRDRLQFPLDVGYEYIQRVMAEAGDVVDANKTREEADPYVLALVLQLIDGGKDAVVVTNDTVPRFWRLAGSR